MGIREELAERSGNDEMLFADGYDDSLIGYTDGGVAVYSIEIIIRIKPDASSKFYYLWNVIDKLRIGAVYAVILEAFKLGS